MHEVHDQAAAAQQLSGLLEVGWTQLVHAGWMHVGTRRYDGGLLSREPRLLKSWWRRMGWGAHLSGHPWQGPCVP